MDDILGYLIVGLMVLGIVGVSLAGIANNYYTDKNAMEHGLHQEQLIGASGYRWVK